MASVRFVTQVRPVLSSTPEEARRRVFNLYKGWIREIPLILQNYHITVSDQELKKKVRQEILKNAHITDIRAIDLLVIKAQEHLYLVSNFYLPTSNLMDNFKETVNPKPTDFLSKFLSGHDP